jgi:hypothetical protein
MLEAKRLLNAAGLNETVWGATIILAENRGYFLDQALFEADNWTTCACGQLDAHVEMDEDGPVDKWLRHMGSEFAVAVFEHRIVRAARLLCDIQARSITLLQEALVVT